MAFISADKGKDLLVFDAGDEVDTSDPRIDITAWSIHGAMHRNNPAARCWCISTLIMQQHCSALRTLIYLRLIRPLRVFITGWRGIAGLTGWVLVKRERLSRLLGNHNVLMMGQHGILTAASSPALAWDITYHLERACKNYITALSANRPLAHLSDDIAEKLPDNGRIMMSRLAISSILTQ